MCRTARDGRHAVRLAAAAAMLFVVIAGEGAAEQLPVKAYTVEHGLAHNRVKRIVQDSHGFLWFCTADGLSRFDGTSFTNYRIEDGLLAPSINDIAETSDGVYWVATNSDGVFRLDLRASATAPRPGAQSRFTQFRIGAEQVANRVNVLYRDSAGMLWAGTDGGLFSLNLSRGEQTFSPIALHIPQHADIQTQVWAVLADRAGNLWIGTKYGIVLRRLDGTMIHLQVEPSPLDDPVFALMLARDGRLWVGHRAGLIVFDPDTGLAATRARATSQPLLRAARRYTTKDGLSNDIVLDVHESSNGRIWIRTFASGLTEFDGRAFRTYWIGQRAIDLAGALTEDREGNLWLGTDAHGALKITKHGWTTYGEPEGLGASVSSIFETPAGELYASSSGWLISRLAGGKVTTVRPGLPKTITDSSWRDVNNVLMDHNGDWWIATRAGLHRFARTDRFETLAQSRPIAIYTERNGLANDDVTRIFEDSRGDVWISSWIPSRDVVVRWERATGRFHRYSEAGGLRPFTSVVSFGEDAAGNVWIGLRDGGLARYRGGRFTMLARDDGVPVGSVNGIYRDLRGRMWAAASRGGLYRIDNPNADQPRIVVYTTRDGLASDTAATVTGDAAGRIYVGTPRGVDRLDPATGTIKHYSTANGLVGSEFKAALRDRNGALWFCTTTGLARLVPELDAIAPPPPALIGSLRIAGILRPLSTLGESSVSALELAPAQNNIQIDFFGVGFRTGEALRFQYKLEGGGAEWSAPSDQRSVNYANLAPGAYRFFVRAVGTDGVQRQPPAVVSFEVLPPVWRRWWFIAMVAVILGSAAAALARYRHERVEALRESENRFRTLMETASDAIITIDEQSRIVLVNQAAEKVFGYTREEMIGAELTMLMPQALRQRHRAGFTRYMRTGDRNIAWDAIELPGLHKHGHEVPLEISFGEFTRKGRRYFTGIARDITERKRAEDALRRSREERFAELERVRKRIATDLHDDIGSSLTRISLIGEVLKRQAGGAGGDAQAIAEPLGSISDLSRELVDSMSDIVWAINPTKDHLSDLTQRMRHFASDVFTARGIEFRFRTPDAERDIRMGANIRRELFLIFKEAVNNMVRHSGCSQAELELRVESEVLVLTVSDNGRGFAITDADSGHGLLSMRERTEALGGHVEVLSRPGQGTLLSFMIPFVEQPQATTKSGAPA